MTLEHSLQIFSIHFQLHFFCALKRIRLTCKMKFALHYTTLGALSVEGGLSPPPPFFNLMFKKKKYKKISMGGVFLSEGLRYPQP